MSVNYEISDIFNYTYTGPVSTTNTGTAAVAEISTAEFNTAFAANTGGEYFVLWSANDATGYYVWLDYNGDATTQDPAPGGLTGIVADVSNAISNNSIATAVRAAVDGNADFVATGPIAEVSSLDFTGSFAGLTQGQYMTLYAGTGTGYYAWMDTANDQTTGDPAPGGFTEIAVNVSAVASDNDIAIAFRAAFNAVAGGHFIATGTNPIVTVTNAEGASVTNSANVNITGLAVSTSTQGVGVNTDTIVTITNAATGPTTDVANFDIAGASVAFAVSTQGSGAPNAGTGLLYRDAANDDEVRILAAGSTNQVLTVTATNVIGWATPSSEVSTNTGFRVVPAAAQTIASTSLTTYTDVVWGTEIFDAGANFATNRYTAPSNGTYWFETSIEWSIVNKSNKGQRRIQIVEDPAGTPVALTTGDQPPVSNKSLAHYQNTSVLVVATAADVFGVRVSHTAGAGDDQDVGTNSYFQGIRIA